MNRHLVALSLVSVVALGTSVAEARPHCTLSHQTNIHCHPEGGSERLPEVCYIPVRTCGMTVYIENTHMTCKSPARGSLFHHLLLAYCNSVGNPERTDVPPELEEAAGELAEDPIKLYPDLSSYDFGDGRGLVKAHRHPNGRGIVADSVTFADPASVYISPGALVFGNAWIGPDVTIMGKSEVFGDAVVTDGAFVADYARVHDKAEMRYWAEATNNAEVGGTARLECGGAARDDAKLVSSVFVEGYDTKQKGDDCGGLMMSSAPGQVRGTAQPQDGVVVSSGQVLWK